MKRIFKEDQKFIIFHKKLKDLRKKYGRDISMANGYAISVLNLESWLISLNEVCVSDIMAECRIKYEIANDVMNILVKRNVLKFSN